MAYGSDRGGADRAVDGLVKSCGAERSQRLAEGRYSDRPDSQARLPLLSQAEVLQILEMLDARDSSYTISIREDLFATAISATAESRALLQRRKRTVRKFGM